jgi:hypothetical protein
MTTSREEIYDRLLANYENAVSLIPEKLRKEFKNKVFRPEDLKSYAEIIFLAKQFQSKVLTSFLEDYTRLRFSIEGFGRKLAMNNISPERVHAELFQGILNN